MRLEPKPAAALCAASFALLLIFGTAWPGPGLWLLAASLIFLAAAAGAWWLDAAPAQSRVAPAQRVAHTPFAAAPARPAAGGGGRLITAESVHVAAIAAAIGVLALILFIGGALSGGDDAPAPAAVALESNPRIIDLSRESDPTALPTPAAGDAAAPAQPITTTTPPATTAPTATAGTTAAASQPRPIVVADPEPATPVQVTPRAAEAAAAPPARTVQHTVVEGDSLYGIALEYDTTVDAIEALNGITAATVIHPGDILLIPQPDE